MNPVVLLAGLASLWRWLRVAQREHYLAPMVSRSAGRWWRLGENLMVLGSLLVVGCYGSVRDFEWLAGLVGLGAAVGPVGLPWRGRTSPLAFTWRMKRLTGVAVALTVSAMWLTGVWGWLVVLATPVMMDLALMITRPYEALGARRWIVRARDGLERSGVRTVAITGSYGKTSTKFALAHLLSGVTSVVASPASFNNAMGLARAVNEQLTPGTEVFIAEMGTYGPGEIARMCRWVKPEVAVITAIGPVHLERMKTLDVIARAKREILAGAKVGVLMVDDPHLRRIAEEERERIEIVRVSITDPDADVALDPTDGAVRVRGRSVGVVRIGTAHPVNVVCALGAVVALGLDVARVLDRVSSIPDTPHRASIGTGEGGATIIDDTFNSNPAGARIAIERLVAAGSAGRKVLVTPGMVEMGSMQYEANRAMIDPRLTDLVIVGRTNRAALRRGAADAGLESVIVTGDRVAAVEWVKTNLGPGDAVLYENDLPDHHP